MSVTASLVSGSNPPLVQIVIDSIPAGQFWTLNGHVGGYTEGLAPGEDVLPGTGTLLLDSEFVPGGYAWRVPGGSGVSDGGQIVLVDNRSPGNVPYVYTVTTEDAEQSSGSVRVPFATDLVLQSLNGQRSLAVQLLDGSLDQELEPNVSLFRVPGRARPVVRYDVLSDVTSTLNVLVPVSDSYAFRALIASGDPMLYRLGAAIMDLDPVAVLQITSVTSKAYASSMVRVWSLGYVLVDDPEADIRLGAFTWDVFDDALSGADWDDGFDARFVGLDWDHFDTVDWANA